MNHEDPVRTARNKESARAIWKLFFTGLLAFIAIMGFITLFANFMANVKLS